MSMPDFAEVKAVVLNEVIHATNAYTLLTGLAFPMSNQPLLRQHYPFIIDNLANALTGQVLMTVCRLFDPDDDPRHASLSNFLKRAQSHHAKDRGVSLALLTRRSEYERRIPEFVADLKNRWATLVIHRSAYLAHRDLSKKVLPAMTYGYIRECFELAEQVFGGYLSAYEDTTQVFEIAGVKHDPERFLQWCRLDDYERHFNEHMQRWEKKLRQDLGGLEGPR